jgi:anthranilate/para-aminobenzoate synthase component II
LHDSEGLFRGLENPLVVGRYHSLAVSESSLPRELEVCARGDGDQAQELAAGRRSVPSGIDTDTARHRSAEELLAG